MSLFPRKVKGHPEDAAVRVALREVAREAVSLDRRVRKAERLDEETLRRQLRECASFAHHGYSRPEDLRELAGLALALARRLEAASGEREHDRRTDGS